MENNILKHVESSGLSAFTPMEQKLLNLLHHHGDVTINSLFVSIWPDREYIITDHRHRQRRLGNLICKVNKKFRLFKLLYVIKPGTTRRTYAIKSL